ncbi:MAG TPA: MFS transporter, partial [Actinomycetes bacterium]|nr:MFS transporter [Actinomycetes bacterium]
IDQNPAVPDSVKAQADVELAGGVPFISDADLQAALDQAGVSEETAAAVLEANRQARLDGLRAALVVLAGVALLALFAARRIPTTQPGSTPSSGRADEEAHA